MLCLSFTSLHFYACNLRILPHVFNLLISFNFYYYQLATAILLFHILIYYFFSFFLHFFLPWHVCAFLSNSYRFTILSCYPKNLQPNQTKKTHFITATHHEIMQPKNQTKTKINNTSNKSPSTTTTTLTKTNNYKPNNNNNNNNTTFLKRVCACVK